MKFLSVAVIVVICAFAVADEHYDHYAHPKYEFKYGVKDLKTGDIKDQWEHRDGDQVKGAYTFKEADGTTRLVEYHADGHSGFHAEVKNIGHAHHAEEHHQHNDHHGDHQEHYAHHVQQDAHQGHYAHHVEQDAHQGHYAHHVQHDDHHGDGGWEDQHQHHQSHDHGHDHVKSYIDVHHY